MNARGLAHLRNNRPNEALAAFESALREAPDDHVLLRNRALTLSRLQRHEEARSILERLIANAPNDRHVHGQLAAVLRELGQHTAALEHYRRAGILEADAAARVIEFGRYAAAHSSRGEAEDALRKWLAQHGPQAAVLRELGMVLLDGRRFAEASLAFEQSLRMEPNSAGAWNNLGIALQRLNHHASAMECFQQTIRCDPAIRLAQFNLALSHAALQQWPEAAAQLEELGQQPGGGEQYPGFERSLGDAYFGLGCMDKAIGAYEAALQRDAQDLPAQLGLAQALEHQNRYLEAASAYQQATERHPASSLSWVKQGLFARKTGEAASAREAFERMNQCEPSAAAQYLRTTTLPIVYDDEAEVATWRERCEREVAELLKVSVQFDADLLLSTAFHFAYQGYNDRPLNERLGRLWQQASVPGISRSPRRDGRLRVGVFSSFLRYHTIGKFVRGWIKELSREHFEVSVASPCEHHDEGAQWIRAAADRHIGLASEPSKALVQLAAEQFDVLLFPEIGMDPLTCAIARHRVAPVQCTTWGHPVTSGLPTIDYFLSSRLLEVAHAQQHYTEQLVLFTTLPTYYYHPPRPLADKQRGDFGLEAHAHVYACPHSLFKLHPSFDKALAGILAADPEAIVVMLEWVYPTATERLRQRLKRTLGANAERVVFLPQLPHTEYLRLLELSDVLLDSFPFGGGNTHYEAISVGLPVVTLPTEFLRGRVGLGVYRKLGIGELIATDVADYVQRAVQVASDSRFQAELRSTILARKHHLYEDTESVRELEAFLLHACGRRSALACPSTSIPFSGARTAWENPASEETLSPETLRQATCPACGHHVAVPFFDPGPLPLATLAWPASADEALQMRRLPHDFVRCVDCGHFYNARFKYEDVPYADRPNLMFNKGTLWREHLQNVARIVCQHLPAHPVAVEIGCGDGHMLRSLAALRAGRYIGFDPNGGVDTAGGLIEARQELFDPAKHLEQLRPDVLISRHVLEHLMNPLAFVQAVSFAVSWAQHPVLLFIEVPCVDHVLALGRTSDFYYEHNSHFTTYSLRRLIERCAGQVELLETAYGQEVAYALARFEPQAAQVQLAREALEFRSRSRAARITIQQQLAALSGARVAVWGGTGKAAAFIQQHQLDHERFPLVVDSDPQKVGTFVPGGGQQIRSPRALLETPADVILIATPWRAADIVLELEALGIRAARILVEFSGRLVDYFHDAHPYQATSNSRPAPPESRSSAASARRLDSHAPAPAPHTTTDTSWAAHLPGLMAHGEQGIY